MARPKRPDEHYKQQIKVWNPWNSIKSKESRLLKPYKRGEKRFVGSHGENEDSESKKSGTSSWKKRLTNKNKQKNVSHLQQQEQCTNTDNLQKRTFLTEDQSMGSFSNCDNRLDQYSQEIRSMSPQIDQQYEQNKEKWTK